MVVQEVFDGTWLATMAVCYELLTDWVPAGPSRYTLLEWICLVISGIGYHLHIQESSFIFTVGSISRKNLVYPQKWIERINRV